MARISNIRLCHRACHDRTCSLGTGHSHSNHGGRIPQARGKAVLRCPEKSCLEPTWHRLALRGRMSTHCVLLPPAHLVLISPCAVSASRLTGLNQRAFSQRRTALYLSIWVSLIQESLAIIWNGFFQEECLPWMLSSPHLGCEMSI